jgi:hypothetical protein
MISHSCNNRATRVEAILRRGEATCESARDYRAPILGRAFAERVADIWMASAVAPSVTNSRVSVRPIQVAAAGSSGASDNGD